MGRRRSRVYNLDLFTDEAEVAAAAQLSPWPDAQRFPLNVDHHQVKEQVVRDLRGSDHPLIVTGDADLWPTQRQGIAQALLVLSQQGSVLVADATGSGKTRTGTHLIRAVQDQIIRSGRLRQGKALMVCPPAVQDNWLWESHLCGVPLDTYSHGSLSHKRSGRHELTVEGLRRAQILCVEQMSDACEQAKARKLKELADRHDLLLAFDSRPLTLAVMQQHLKRLQPKLRTIVATGDPGSGRAEILETFKPGSTWGG